MAKDKVEKQVEKKIEQSVVKSNIVTLKSRANYIIEVIDGNVHKMIQPFGKVKVNKSELKLTNDNDAKFLTFIK